MRRDTLWSPACALARAHPLKPRFNETELSVRFPNGSVIYLVGADSNEDERQKLLGRSSCWL